MYCVCNLWGNILQSFGIQKILVPGYTSTYQRIQFEHKNSYQDSLNQCPINAD